MDAIGLCFLRATLLSAGRATRRFYRSSSLVHTHSDPATAPDNKMSSHNWWQAAKKSHSKLQSAARSAPLSATNAEEGSRFVECPACGASMHRQSLNHHLDLDCPVLHGYDDASSTARSSTQSGPRESDAAAPTRPSDASAAAPARPSDASRYAACPVCSESVLVSDMNYHLELRCRGAAAEAPAAAQLEVIVHVAQEHRLRADRTRGVARGVRRSRWRRSRGVRGPRWRCGVALARPGLDAAAGRRAGVAAARMIAVAVQDGTIQVQVMVEALPVHRRAARRAFNEA